MTEVFTSAKSVSGTVAISVGRVVNAVSDPAAKTASTGTYAASTPSARLNFTPRLAVLKSALRSLKNRVSFSSTTSRVKARTYRARSSIFEPMPTAACNPAFVWSSVGRWETAGVSSHSPCCTTRAVWKSEKTGAAQP